MICREDFTLDRQERFLHSFNSHRLRKTFNKNTESLARAIHATQTLQTILTVTKSSDNSL